MGRVNNQVSSQPYTVAKSKAAPITICGRRAQQLPMAIQITHKPENGKHILNITGAIDVRN